MLLSCITHLRQLKKEWRNVRLYGQERNLMTSSIARMNCFLHGVEDFHIERGDTLAEPKFVQGDRLQRFDEARGAAQKAVELAPDDEKCRSFQKQLEAKR